MSAWAAAKNVLCVRLDNLGDVLMTTPAIRALRQSVPGRRITLLASPGGARVARFVPEIDDVIEFEAPWMKATSGRPTADGIALARLDAKRFDAAVIFTVYSQSPLPAAYLCYLAGIPLRLAHCRENPYQLLTDWVKEREPEHFVRHEVRRQLDLVATVGGRTDDERLSFRIPDPARAAVERLLARLGVGSGEMLLVAHCGASAASRRYPPASYARALDLIVEDTGAQLVLTGDAAEAALIEDIRSRMRSPGISLAGALELDELGALLAQADLLVSNNTGPVHLAAALGTPIVDLYALTNPQHTPWNVEHRVLYHDVPCRYCYKSVCPSGHHGCLDLVRPEEVARAATELLSNRGAGRSLPPLVLERA